MAVTHCYLTGKSLFHLCTVCFCIIYICLLSSSLHAQDSTTATTAATTSATVNPEDSFLQRWFHSFENIRDAGSREYVSLASHMDSYFSGEPYVNMQNKSNVLLELKNTQYAAGQHASDVNIRARLRLPNTQKKVNVIFTTDAKEEKTLQDRVQGEASGERLQNDHPLAGLEYVPDITKRKWEQSFAGGIRLNMHSVFFTRYKFNKEWQLVDEWKSYFDQSFWYFSDKGYGATNEIDFKRPLSKIDMLDIGTDIEYRDASGAYTYDLIASNTHQITNASNMEYSVGAFGTTQPTNWITSYYIGISYRKVLYKDWLIFEAVPQVSFPRDADWKATPSFTIGLKIYFSE
jgi:hypothetical protein